MIHLRDRVKVTHVDDDDGVDDEHPPRVGQCGVVVARLQDHGASPSDPMFRVRFRDGYDAYFGTELIRL